MPPILARLRQMLDMKVGVKLRFDSPVNWAFAFGKVPHPGMEWPFVIGLGPDWAICDYKTSFYVGTPWFRWKLPNRKPSAYWDFS